MDTPLISIIVPVFRVEQYLDKCVQSILAQTYCNLEVILVDDGSPDACGEICDYYSASDSRVRVLHKENGGQASARNAGLRIARGEYFAFIDSDDSVDPKMYESLINNLIAEKADISVCQLRRINERGELLQEETAEEISLFDNAGAMEELVADRCIQSHPCNKLFKRALWDGVFFPESRVYEDIAIMHEVFHHAEKVVVSSAMMYNYLIRGNSTSYTQSSKWGFDLYCAFRDRHEFVKKNYPALEESSRSKFIGIAVGMFIHWQKFSAGVFEREAERDVRNALIQEKSAVMKIKSLSAGRKMDALCIIYCPWITKIKYRVFFSIKRG